MEIFRIENLKFAYPDMSDETGMRYLPDAVSDINVSIHQGEFLVILGSSGCGKTTFLRQLKPLIAPKGRLEGNVFFKGEPINDMTDRTQAQSIGFVMQDVDAQLVTDKVWHELAFGLESLGYDNGTIRRRVAEMSSFFGLESIFHSKVTALSGGQKQLVNLASVMATAPDVLILDEPTSQLDPIAANEFIGSLVRINRELGTTIIMTEHRLEEVLTVCSRAIIMEAGHMIADDKVALLAKGLNSMENSHALMTAMPAAVQIYMGLLDEKSSDMDMPVSVNDGRSWLMAYDKYHSKICEPEKELQIVNNRKSAILELQDIYFRYDREGQDILRGLSLSVFENEILMINGSNGSGKSTLLSIVAGIRRPYAGKLKIAKDKTVGMLPQDPKTLFTRNTVRDELAFAKSYEQLKYIVGLCHLEKLLDRHPYDLSGGEQQRLAIARVLMYDPDIILMDEPTKGLDNGFKQELIHILQSLQEEGRTIVIVSHDIEFCGAAGERIALLFDGECAAVSDVRSYFTGNSFYTTAAARIAKDIVDGAVTVEEVITAYKGKQNREEAPDGGLRYRTDMPDVQGDSADIRTDTPDVQGDSADIKTDTPAAPDIQGDCSNKKIEGSGFDDLDIKLKKDRHIEKLSLPRCIAVIVSSIIIIYCFIKTVSQSELNKLIKGMAVTREGVGYIILYAVFICAIVCLLIALKPLGKQADEAIALDAKGRGFTKGTIVTICTVLIFIPFTIWFGYDKLQDRKYYFISLLVLIEAMVPFFAAFESRKPKIRELVTIAVMCALAVAGRAAFFMLPNFSPVMAIVIIAGVAFGAETGFVTGAVTMIVSNMMFGQGPWTPWQMFSLGLVGFLAGLVFAHKGVRTKLLTKVGLCIFGGLACIVIYGGIMNPASVIMWQQAVNMKMILAAYVTGFPFDVVQATATVLFLWLAARPFLEKLDRIRIKYGMVSL